MYTLTSPWEVSNSRQRKPYLKFLASQIDIDLYLASFYYANIGKFSPTDIHEVVAEASFEVMMDIVEGKTLG